MRASFMAKESSPYASVQLLQSGDSALSSPAAAPMTWPEKEETAVIPAASLTPFLLGHIQLKFCEVERVRRDLSTILFAADLFVFSPYLKHIPIHLCCCHSPGCSGNL